MFGFFLGIYFITRSHQENIFMFAVRAAAAAAASNHLMCKVVVIIIRHFPCYLNLVCCFSGNQIIWFRLISVDLIQLPEGNISSVYWLCCIKLKTENSELCWDGMEWNGVKVVGAFLSFKHSNSLHLLMFSILNGYQNFIFI